MRSVFSFLCVAAVLLGCGSKTEGTSDTPEPSADTPEPSAETPEPSVSPAPAKVEALIASSEGADLLARFECNRCHAGTGLPEPPLEKQCVGCHRQIMAGEMDGAPEQLAVWKGNLKSLPIAPDLAHIGHKLTRTWVSEFLRKPHKVRPGLPASMPRLSINESEAATLASALVPQLAKDQSFSQAAVGRGATLFNELNCNACHAHGSTPARPRQYAEGTTPDGDALALAPDLALTRHRFQSGMLVTWLRNPQGVDPETLMPNFHLTESQATSIAAFLWFSSEQPPALAPIAARLPVLEREVGWEEVFSSVFKTVCWHCHASADFAMGDGGAGNTGGFGYPAKGFDVSSYESIRSGAFGPDGRRRSVFANDETGVPLLLSVLLARRDEERGHQREERIGMPLGFPAMTAEQIQLVESWIAQGRPR